MGTLNFILNFLIVGLLALILSKLNAGDAFLSITWQITSVAFSGTALIIAFIELRHK